jgi:MFS family permease
MGVIKENLTAEGLQGNELAGRVKIWGGLYSFFLNLGAALGMIFFGYLAQRLNRRWAFFFAFSSAMIATAATFWLFDRSSMTFWLTPIMGFCLLSIFAVLAIYFRNSSRPACAARARASVQRRPVRGCPRALHVRLPGQ